MGNTQFKIEGEQPHVSEVLPMYFGAGFILILALFIFVVEFVRSPSIPIVENLIQIFPLIFASIIFYLFSLVRTKAHSERIEIVDGILYVYRKEIRRWFKPIEEIENIDIETFSENLAMRGQTLIVFYIKNGQSWSTSYVNYTEKQLKELKRFVETSV